MPKSNETETSTDAQTVVDEKVSEAKARLDRTREQLNTVRQVMSDARDKRDTAVSDAEKVFGERYNEGRVAQQNELRNLDEAYAEVRSEITTRWSNELAALSEARDIAISQANSEYEDTSEAAKQTFGGDAV